MKKKSYTLLMPRYWPLWCVIGIIRLIILLPYPWMIKTGQLLGYLVFWLQKSKKKRILQNNLDHCLPSLSIKEKVILCRSFYQNLVIGCLETALAWWKNPSHWDFRVKVEGLYHVHKALTLGKGVILLYSHQMSFELIGRHLSTQIPIHAVYRPNPNLFLNELMHQRRQSFLQGLIAKHQVKRFLHILKTNEIVAIAPDQSMKEPFMNLPSKNILGLIKLTQLTGATVIPLTCHRDLHQHTYHIRLLPPFKNLDVDHVCLFLKQTIQSQPEQYLWLQRKIRTKGSML